MADDQIILDIMQTLCGRLSDTILQLTNQIEKAIALGLSILGIGFSVGIKENFEYAIVIVPFGFFLLIFYAATCFHQILSFAGYKQELEKEINKLCGRKVVFWEELSEKLITKSVPLFSLYLFIFSLFGASSIYAYQFLDWNETHGKTLIIAWIIFTFFCLVSMFELTKAKARGTDIARKFLDSDVQSSTLPEID